MTPMPKLRCPQCGAEMNRHAEKVVHAQSSAEMRLVDAALGGLLEETHACPRCGNVESRRVQLADWAEQAQDIEYPAS